MKINNSKYDIFIEGVCFICLIGTLLYLAITWQHIPNEIPGHYNAIGEIDKITDKDSLIALPVISWIMYIGITMLERFPQIWNTGVKVTEENKERVYRILKNMIGTVKLLIIVMLSYMTINSSLVMSLSAWFLLVWLILIFGSIIFFLIKLLKGK